MSSLDSGLDIFGSPFSPLTHSLIRGNMPNTMAGPLMPGQQAPPAPGPLTAAHMAARNRARGIGTGPQPNAPMNSSVIAAAMLDAAGVDDATKAKLKDRPLNEIKDYLSVRHQYGQKQPSKQPLVRPEDFGPQQAPAQPTIGGPTPAGVAPGSMQVLQGHGKNAMAAEDLARWQQNIQGKLGAGESLDVNGIGAGPAQQRQPGTTYRELTGTPGFSVGGLTPPPQPQAPQSQNPAVQLLQQLGQAGIPQQQLELYKTHLLGGGTMQEVLTHANQYLHDQQTRSDKASSEQRAGARADRQIAQQEFQNNKSVLGDLERDAQRLQKQIEDAGGPGRADPNAVAELGRVQHQIGDVRGRMQSFITPGQQPVNPQQTVQQQPSSPQQPGMIQWNGRQFQAGQTIQGPDGKPYRITGKLHSDNTPEIVPG